MARMTSGPGWVALAWLVLHAQILQAATTGLENVRMWHSPDKSRLVFDLSGPVRYSVYELDDPPRLVVDLVDSEFRGVLPPAAAAGPYIQRVRKGTPSPNVLRIVLDLHHAVRSEVLVLPPNDTYGHRLVIDIAAPEKSMESGTSVVDRRPVAPTGQRQARRAPLVVAVDPGHGGEDPGAIGGRKTREKEVVLAIGRRLVDRINADPRLSARLTRRGDYYISLRERTRLAREYNADLFISIHADGFYNRSARGMSVYALSNKGATSETARWLADKENASDLVGGVSLHDKDDLLAQVLLDLSMTRTVSDGIAFARFVLQQLRELGPVHSRRVEQAGFAVLKSPDIPSILVETGYITNPDEERLLRSGRYQERLAGAIYQGIVDYLAAAEMFPDDPGPTVHLVSSGESLSILAVRYGVSVASLKRLNGLNDNRIFVGQRLKIPQRDG